MLVTNGCSFVWGDELEGFMEGEHEHLTFTHHLADHLGMEYRNISSCGNCNAKIFRDTINEMEHNHEITHMVIIWSAWQRDEVAESHPPNYEEEMKIQRFQCMTQISPSRLHFTHRKLQKVLDPFYDVINVERNGIMHTLTYMHAMKLLCEAKGIKLIQGGFHERMWVNYLDCFTRMMNKGKNWGKNNDYIKDRMEALPDHHRVGLGRYVDMFSMARSKFKIKPFGHPDEDTHREYANLLSHIFETTKW
jgi:hypothetical protein